MLKHVVMYKLKEPKAPQKLVDTFLSMKGRISALKDIEAGSDVLRSDRSFDVALICTFEDMAGLNAYQNDPVHLVVKKYVHEVVEKSISVDFLDT